MQQTGRRVLMAGGWVALILYLVGVALPPSHPPMTVVARQALTPTPTSPAITPIAEPAQVRRSLYLPLIQRTLSTPPLLQQAGTARYVRTTFSFME